MKRFPAVGRRSVGAHRVRDVAVLLVAVALDVFLFSDAVVGNPPEAGGPRTSPVVVFCCAGVCFGLLLFRQRARMQIFWRCVRFPLVYRFLPVIGRSFRYVSR